MIFDPVDILTGFFAGLFLAALRAIRKSKRLTSLAPPPVAKPNCEACPLILALKQDDDIAAKILKGLKRGLSTFLLIAIAALIVAIVLETRF